MTTSTHLHLSGWLTSDGFRSHPGRESSEPLLIPESSDRFAIQLRSDTEIISRGQVWAQFNGQYRRWRLRASVPYLPGVSRLTITERGRIVHEIGVAARPPVVEVTRVAVAEETLFVEWRSHSSDALTFSVAVVIPDHDPIPLARHATATSLTVSLLSLPASPTAAVLIRGSDGVRSSEVSSATFPLLGGAPPSCVIARPSEGQVLPALQPISLLGSAWHLDGAELPRAGLQWRIDGQLVGSGTNLLAVPRVAQGEHSVELRHSSAAIAASRAFTVAAIEPTIAAHIKQGLLPPP